MQRFQDNYPSTLTGGQYSLGAIAGIPMQKNWLFCLSGGRETIGLEIDFHGGKRIIDFCKPPNQNNITFLTEIQNSINYFLYFTRVFDFIWRFSFFMTTIDKGLSIFHQLNSTELLTSEPILFQGKEERYIDSVLSTQKKPYLETQFLDRKIKLTSTF